MLGFVGAAEAKARMADAAARVSFILIGCLVVVETCVGDESDISKRRVNI
jgi:hypothetical protein